MRLDMLRSSRARAAFIHDIVMAALSLPIALYLRLGDALFLQLSVEELLKGTAMFTLIAAPVFLASGLYRGIWRYASMHDLTAIARAVTITILVFVLALFLATRLEGFPRSAFVINGVVLVLLLGGSRFVYRLYKDRDLGHILERGIERRAPVLLVGAGDEAETFIRAVARNPAAAYRVVGIIDERSRRVGRRIHETPVLGTIDELDAVIARLRRHDDMPQRLVIAKDQLDPSVVRNLLDRADALGLGVARMPRLTELKAEAGGATEIRPIALEDVLGRPQAVLDREGMAALIRGRRVLVTGAGGTIGGELARQVAALAPARLVLFESSEFNLYTIDADLSERHPAVPRASIIGDVRDAEFLRTVLARERPEIVFHAAALKHVPIVELNPEEGVLTNAIGTRNVADACRATGVACMVMISTDKAVNPPNVMGASKRLAEAYCQALDLAEASRRGTRFVTVRFGNVLGSTGSVVPLFQRQIARGGPITVTHPEMTRYFMTVREAVELVLQATVLGVGDDARRGRIFVLDMGEPVRIVDLARQMIRLAGLVPDKDISIVFTGMRPGEQLSETLFHGDEPLQATAREGVLIASPRVVDAGPLAQSIAALEAAALAHDAPRTLALLATLVPEYRRRVAPAIPASATG